MPFCIIIITKKEKGEKMALGEKVRVKREEMKLTQAELAKKSGITQATISRIESGEVTQLRSDKLKGLAQTLGVTVDFLVGKKERMEFNDALAADENAKIIFRGYEKLPDERRKQLRDFVNWLIEQEKKRG
jgi:transcriptional regulator with XRE-family HTH domain